MPLTLGCDPELVCRINGKFTPAHHHFKSNSSMGLDGNESVAEVRPGFSESPIDLTAKIRTILEYGFEKNNNLEFYSGHYVDDYPIGGHIHIGAEPTSKVINALDVTLDSLSQCIDDLDQRKKRENTGYGKRCAYRTKSYGLEYRTPGSWLLSPSVTLVTLTLSKLSVFAATEYNYDFIELKGREKPKSFLRTLHTRIKDIPPDCEEGLNELQILLSMKKIDWSQNILPNWGICNYDQLREAA